MRMVIIRHGQITPNIINGKGRNLYIGALNNDLTNLTEEGIRSAKELANNDEVKKIEKIYCSDLNRAIDTAKILRPDLQLNIDKNLSERSLGIFEGKKAQDLLDSEKYKKYILDENYNKFRGHFEQKAPNGESYTDVKLRCKRFLDSLDLNEDITIGIVTHQHCIKGIFLNLLKIEPKEKIFELQIENCVPYILEGNRKNGFRLISHNLEEMLKNK